MLSCGEGSVLALQEEQQHCRERRVPGGALQGGSFLTRLYESMKVSKERAHVWLEQWRWWRETSWRRRRRRRWGLRSPGTHTQKCTYSLITVRRIRPGPMVWREGMWEIWLGSLVRSLWWIKQVLEVLEIIWAPKWQDLSIDLGWLISCWRWIYNCFLLLG